MTLDLSLAGVFLLVLARTGAWVLAAPIFSLRGLSSLARLALALALALFLAPIAASKAVVPADTLPFLVAAAGQVLVGLALGWVTGLLLHAFQAAGTAIDVMSGFSVSTLMDPVDGQAAALFSRFTNLLFVTLLFATDGHHLVIEGFVRSLRAVPVDRFPTFSGNALAATAHAVSALVIAAIEIGAPVLGALFLTEVALAVASRFDPHANVFLVGLPLKVLITLFAAGSMLLTLPNRLAHLIEAAVRLGASVFG